MGGCQKNVPIDGRFFVTFPNAAILISEQVYDKRFRIDWMR
ncbi:hypothetical protein D3OALGB2SA_5508 [Olavius algarvensis associated proteobacterium Delta 3]|nr:hypothetical protein D3OALGB2SA_5508 [Olavius algarvensis associated proteobacterium Delta 3]